MPAATARFRLAAIEAMREDRRGTFAVPAGILAGTAVITAAAEATIADPAAITVPVTANGAGTGTGTGTDRIGVATTTGGIPATAAATATVTANWDTAPASSFQSIDA